MANKLIRIAISLITIAVLCFAFYDIGQTVGESKAKIQIVEKQVEVIRYVDKKKAQVYSKPNIGRDSALQLFTDGKL